MKVCTDATLFGAMAPVVAGERVLDIGTGTGLLALMVAQLGAGEVTAFELTESAFKEACTNILRSPWSDRIDVFHADIRDFALTVKEDFDFIICNPPFFDRHSKSANALKQLARHTDELPFGDLLTCVDRLLAQRGQFYVLLPSHAVERFVREAKQFPLFLTHRVNVKGYARNQYKVAMLLFSRVPGVATEENMIIYSADRVYSEKSERYLSEFLLRFQNSNDSAPE